MKLAVELNKKIIEFFLSLPGIEDADNQRALIYSASLDPQLQGQIRFDTTPTIFFQLLVPTLVDYGILPDGRNALVAVLETAKQYIGKDGQRYCDTIIQEIPTDSSISEKRPEVLSEKKRLNTEIEDLRQRWLLAYKKISDLSKQKIEADESETIRKLEVSLKNAHDTLQEIEQKLSTCTNENFSAKQPASILCHGTQTSVDIRYSV